MAICQNFPSVSVCQGLCVGGGGGAVCVWQGPVCVFQEPCVCVSGAMCVCQELCVCVCVCVFQGLCVCFRGPCVGGWVGAVCRGRGQGCWFCLQVGSSQFHLDHIRNPLRASVISPIKIGG